MLIFVHERTAFYFSWLSLPFRWCAQWQPCRSHCSKRMRQVCICIPFRVSASRNANRGYDSFLLLCVCVWNCRYLIQELHRSVTGGDSSVFCRAEQQGKWKLKPGVSFHFFSSHTPCESSVFQVSLLALSQVVWDQGHHQAQYLEFTHLKYLFYIFKIFISRVVGNIV